MNFYVLSTYPNYDYWWFSKNFRYLCWHWCLILASISRTFQHKSEQKALQAESPELRLTSQCRPFLKDVCLILLDRLLAHFSYLWLHLASILNVWESPFVSLGHHVGPFGFIVFHLAPFWRSRTDTAPNDPPKTVFILFLVSWLPVVSGVPELWGPCFDSFRFVIVLTWISFDSCIDLGIVFQQNLYQCSRFVFILNPQSHPPPHTTLTPTT